MNVFGVYRATQAFLDPLRESKGRIVNVGSVAALLPHIGSSAYSGSKAAIEVMSDVLRLELSAFDVSVSLLEPAYVRTLIASKSLGENSPLLQADQDKLREHYGAWAEAFERKRSGSESLAAGPEVTTNAIMHALTNPKPQARYVVATVKGVPAPIVTWLAYLLPDRIQDMFAINF